MGAIATAGCLDGSEPEIAVPDAARIDEETPPVVTGLSADHVTLAAETTIDTRIGPQDWQSSATFEVQDGRVDPAAQTPVSGSYESSAPMGPVWSMEPSLTREAAYFPLESHEVSVTVTPADAEEPRASTTVSRRLPAPETEPLGEGLAGTLHLPDGDGPAPGVLLLHGSGGRELTQRARLLAGHGVVTASIEYFGESHTLRDHLVEVPIEYVRNAIETLAGHDRVAGDRVGLYGVSKGGELALLAGAHSARVGAVASIVGSGLVWAGGSRLSVADTSSWSLDGEPVPYVPIRADEYDRRGSRPTFAEGFAAATEEEIEDATIPVDRIDGQVLLVSAGDDGLWNSVRYSEIAAERLAAHDNPDGGQHLVYEDAGHLVRPPYLPTYGLSRSSVSRLGGTQAGNARAAAEHWPQVVALFEDALGS